MADDIIFPAVSGNARVVGQAITASKNSVFRIAESGNARIVGQTVSASTYLVFRIAESGNARVVGEAEESIGTAFYIAESGTEAIEGEAGAIWQRWLQLIGNAQITANVVYANRYTKDTVLILTLQPGESVVIDAERYTITKNGENLISAHSGEWLDELNAETPNIDVRANASTISAEIEYTPRYL